MKIKVGVVTWEQVAKYSESDIKKAIQIRRREENLEPRFFVIPKGQTTVIHVRNRFSSRFFSGEGQEPQIGPE